MKEVAVELRSERQVCVRDTKAGRPLPSEEIACVERQKIGRVKEQARAG